MCTLSITIVSWCKNLNGLGNNVQYNSLQASRCKLLTHTHTCQIQNWRISKHLFSSKSINGRLGFFHSTEITLMDVVIKQKQCGCLPPLVQFRSVGSHLRPCQLRRSQPPARPVQANWQSTTATPTQPRLNLYSSQFVREKASSGWLPCNLMGDLCCVVRVVTKSFLSTMLADGGNVLLCLNMLIPPKKNCLDIK